MAGSDRLARERRARLRAERLLIQKQQELHRVNALLQRHASTLSEQVIAQRSLIDTVRDRAETTEREKAEVAQTLAQATRTIDIVEQRLSTGIDALSDGFAIYGRDHRLVAANQAYLSPFRKFPDVVQGVPYGRVLEICAHEGVADIGADDPEVWIAQMAARWGNDPIPEMVLHFTNGMSVRLIERRAPNGDVVTLGRNITEVLQREADLREARLRAEDANRAKSAFLANMSHEIRTPMNGVVGMADLLCGTSLSEDQKLYAQTIRTSGEALLAIINDVLDYSKIEADKLTLHPEPFDLERCIHEVLVLLQPEARVSGINLLMDYDLFLPSCFVADPGRMRQVLTNLVGNAVKFTDTGHVLIRVVGAEAHDGSQRVHVTVEDTGIGIAPEDQERIFGEFSQVDDTRNRRFEGTGLGLAITRRLIAMMGGEIWVDSTPGKGSCFGFRISLPVADVVDLAPDSATAAHDDVAPGLLAPLQLNHVLIVDANALHRAILERQLAPHSARLSLCRTEAEALAVQAQTHAQTHATIDLAVIAQDQGGADPAAVARAVHAAGLAAPMVLISTDPAPPEAHDDIFDAIVPQPILRRMLLRRIQALVSAPVPRRPRLRRPASGRIERRLRVLSAEDNRTNRLVFSRMVADLEIEVEFATNGREAVEKFTTFVPDLIFMDISMPEMDGREATQAIRALPGGAAVPIIALTAHAMQGDHEDLLRAGLDGYLTKPLRKRTIIEAIRKHSPGAVLPP